METIKLKDKTELFVYKINKTFIWAGKIKKSELPDGNFSDIMKKYGQKVKYNEIVGTDIEQPKSKSKVNLKYGFKVCCFNTLFKNKDKKTAIECEARSCKNKMNIVRNNKNDFLVSMGSCLYSIDFDNKTVKKIKTYGKSRVIKRNN